MRSLYAGLGFVLLLALPQAVSAQTAFTVTRSTATDAARSLPDADEAILRYRRTSSQRELIFRRAARAAAQREARIQSRRWSGRSAARPNMLNNRPLVQRYGSWRMPRTATYYNRVR